MVAALKDRENYREWIEAHKVRISASATVAVFNAQLANRDILLVVYRLLRTRTLYVRMASRSNVVLLNYLRCGVFLISRVGKVLTISAVVFFGLGVTSCSSEASEGAPSSPSSPPTTDDPASPSISTGQPGGSGPPTPSEDAEQTTASSAPETIETQSYVEELEAMVEENALMYTGNGSGPLAGTRFQTTDGTVHCHMVPNAVACTLPEAVADWPEASRIESLDGGGTGAADTVGWSETVGAPLFEEPRNWQQQDNFPYVDTGVELPHQHKLDISTELEDSDAVCGVNAETVICTVGEHGFAVSQSLYETW